MARANPLFAASNAGEFTPRLAARTDFAKYPNGLETCLNIIPLAEGGAMRRSSTRFVCATKDPAVKSRLRRFQFSTEQAYMIEMGDRYMRFMRHQGQITADVITGAIVNGTFNTDLSGWTDKDTGGSAASTWVTPGYMSLLGDGSAYAWEQQTLAGLTVGADYSLMFEVIGTPGDEVGLRVGTSDGALDVVGDEFFAVGYHCYTFRATAATLYLGFLHNAAKRINIDNVSFLNGAPIEIATPYLAADLYQIEGPQSADVLYLFHTSYPTYKLQRFGHDAWSLVKVFWQDGPWEDMNETTTTLTPSAVTGNGITITASSGVGINDGRGFLQSDVGRLVRIDNPASGINWGWGIITGVASTTSVSLNVGRAFAATTADARWRLGAWSGTTGYPSCAAFFEQRLFAANTSGKPQTLWASNTGDFEVMSPDSATSAGLWDGTVEDDDALDYTISGDDVQSIRWLSPGEDTLAIGTASGEWTPSSTGAVLTPTDIAIRQQTTHGSARVQPVRVGNVVLFVQRAGRKVREFGFEYTIDGYQAVDLTRLAQHITKGGIVEMTYAEEPNSLIYGVRADGTLLTMTYRREEDVVGWARHIIGGVYSADIAVLPLGKARAESVSSIPGADGEGQVENSEDRDEVWVQVLRVVAGQTVRYIEVLEKDFEGPLRGDYSTDALWRAAMIEAQKDVYYADSIITYDGLPTSAISGLDHLEGETVKVLADGAIHPDCVVSGGAITLEREASVVQVGLGYTHRAKYLKMDAGAVAGTAVGKTKVIDALTFVLLDSMTLSFGTALGDLYSTDFRQVSDAVNSAIPLFTGEVRYEVKNGWETDPRVIYESDDPVPFTVLAIAPEIVTQDVK
jgi:hypothetical protein